MTLFKYKAKDKEGKEYERTVEASDRLALYGLIRNEGGVVVSIKEVSKSKFFSLSFSSLSSLKKISQQDKINFAKNLSSMIVAGLSVTRALAVMSKQAKNKKFKELVEGLELEVSKGSTLSDALSKRPEVFSSLFVSMVKAGEESGSLADALKVVASQMEKTYQLAKKVKGAMIYPAVIIGVMVVLAILLLVYMVPTLTATFAGLGITLPLPTRIIIGLSDFLISNFLLVLIFLVFAVTGLVAFFRSERGRKAVDIVSLKLPVIGNLMTEFQVARATRTLSSLLSAGVDILGAIEVTTAVVQNHLYKNVLEEARTTIQKGEVLSQIFGRHDQLFPPFVGEMVSVGEETGTVSSMLSGVADFYENEVDQSTKDLSTIIEPVLMILIGLGVGIFAIAMLMPTYSLVDYI